jgi:hypothetical protein
MERTLLFAACTAEEANPCREWPYTSKSVATPEHVNGLERSHGARRSDVARRGVIGGNALAHEWIAREKQRLALTGRRRGGGGRRRRLRRKIRGEPPSRCYTWNPNSDSWNRCVTQSP